MASYPYVAPSLVGKAGIQSFNQVAYTLAQGAQFLRGDILVKATTGTITVPNPNGSIAAVVPTAPATITLSGDAGQPAAQLIGYYTYIGADSIESLPSQEFFVNIPANYSATVTVPTGNGAPGAATDFALYLGLLSGSEVQQVASTALGSAASVPNPLTNYAGANQATTNADAEILGIALDDYNVNFTAGSAYAQTNTSLFGADVTAPPVGFPEQYSVYVAKLQDQPVEMSLVQAYYPALVGTNVGILYSTAYQTFAADTSQGNKIATIIGKAQGAQNPNYDSVGGIGDTGARVVVLFNTGLI